MKRTLLALALLSTHLTAQSPTSTRSLVVTGCMTRATQSGSLTGAPGVPPATPETAPVLANSQEPTGQLVLENATPAGAGADQRAKPVTYALDGKTADLEHHVGRRVEVTGTLRTSEVGMSAVKTQLERLQVATIKSLGECPRTGAPPNK